MTNPTNPYLTDPEKDAAASSQTNADTAPKVGTDSPQGGQSSYKPSYTAPEPYTQTAAYQKIREKAVTSRGVGITLLCALLGLLFCETLLFTSAGISVPVFVLVLYGIMGYSFYEKGRLPDRRALLLCIPVLLLSLGYFLYFNPSTGFIRGSSLFGLLCVQLTLAGGSRVKELFSVNTILHAACRFFWDPFVNMGLPFACLKTIKGNKSRTVRTIAQILLGLALAVPAAAVLLWLFMRADIIFRDAVQRFLQALHISLGRLAADFLCGLPLGIFLAACLLGLRGREAEEISEKPRKFFVGGMITGTILSVIALLAAVFSGFRLAYLFDGGRGFRRAAMSYAEYARTGFFELCQASALIFILAFFALMLTRRKAGGHVSRYIRALVILLSVCDFILLASACKQMIVYVDVFGLSIRRLLTLWLMLVIGACLVLLIVRCVRERFRLLRGIGIAVIAGVCALGLVNVERTVARVNVDRALSGDRRLDYTYFYSVSYTALPELERLRGTLAEETSDGSHTLPDVIARMQWQFEHRHPIYGFSLDRPQAARIFAQLKEEGEGWAACRPDQ